MGSWVPSFLWVGTHYSQMVRVLGFGLLVLHLRGLAIRSGLIKHHANFLFGLSVVNRIRVALSTTREN